MNVTTTCPSCGDVDLAVGDVRVTQVRGRARRDVSFLCPTCEVRVRVPVDDERVDRLLAAGVPLVFLSPGHPALQERPPHPERPPRGPRFTYDDVIDLHVAMERPDWFLDLLLAFD